MMIFQKLVFNGDDFPKIRPQVDDFFSLISIY